MNANPQIEIEAAEALLDIGVSLPFFKIPFTRKVVRLTMRRPCLGGQIRLARLYLQTGVTYERMLELPSTRSWPTWRCTGGVCRRW